MEPDNPPAVSAWLRRLVVVGLVAVLGAVGLAGWAAEASFGASPA